MLFYQVLTINGYQNKNMNTILYHWDTKKKINLKRYQYKSERKLK